MIKITSVFDTVYRLKELIDNLRYLASQNNNSVIKIAQISFVTPLSITPVSAIIDKKNLKHNYLEENSSYLKTIYFPEGVSDIDKITARKTYLPIIHLCLENFQQEEDIIRQLSTLHTKYLDLLKMNIVADQRFLELITNNTFGLLLGEIFDNIEEHSNAKNVYLFAQYWAKNNACEICVLDDGQGLFGSLKNAGREVENHKDALRKILETGLSAKTEFGSIKRATGIKNIRAAITNKEINGEFLIVSGNVAFLHSASHGEKFVTLSNYTWNGTIIIMRINRPVSQFNLYNYVK
jgi:hypothetical protein